MNLAQIDSQSKTPDPFELSAPLLIAAFDESPSYAGSPGTLVAEADSAFLNVSLPLAQQDAGTTSTSLDTHELSKKIGGFAVLALIVIIVILVVRGKKPKS